MRTCLLTKLQKKPSEFVSKPRETWRGKVMNSSMSLLGVAAVPVSSEGPTPLDVGRLVSHFCSSPWFFGSSYQEAPPVAFLNAWWILDLHSRSTVLLASSRAASPTQDRARDGRSLLLLLVSRGLFSVHARAGRASRLVVRGAGTLLFALAGGLLCVDSLLE